MSIKDWHQNDRPREKLLKFGAEHLTDSELLAIFLRVGVKGQSAVDLAKQLLNEFGSLHHLLQADENRFCQAKGLGSAKYAQLQAVLEMSRRHFESALKQSVSFSEPELAAQYLQHQLADLEREKFGLLLLNQQHQLIQLSLLFEGTLNQAEVHSREVVKTALTHNAAAVILTHNHPSGDPTPSQSDIELTRHLSKALKLVEIRTLDHIIIGNHGRWHSMAEHQQMPD